MNKLILIAFLFLFGCEASQKPEQSMMVSNPDYNVQRLFTEDSCSVYRFEDSGRYHYYTVCAEKKSAETIIARSEYCGKGCVRYFDENINTASRK